MCVCDWKNQLLKSLFYPSSPSKSEQTAIILLPNFCHYNEIPFPYPKNPPSLISKPPRYVFSILVPINKVIQTVCLFASPKVRSVMEKYSVSSLSLIESRLSIHVSAELPDLARLHLWKISSVLLVISSVFQIQHGGKTAVTILWFQL